MMVPEFIFYNIFSGSSFVFLKISCIFLSFYVILNTLICQSRIIRQKQKGVIL